MYHFALATRVICRTLGQSPKIYCHFLKFRPWGHSSIGRHCSDKTDYMTPGLLLGRIPKCTLERQGWRKGMEPRRNTFNIFTDSSETPDGAGAAILFNELNPRQPYKLPNHCTIFQAEVFAVWKTVELAETRTARRSTWQ